jgi:hypothetical protein
MFVQGKQAVINTLAVFWSSLLHRLNAEQIPSNSEPAALVQLRTSYRLQAFQEPKDFCLGKLMQRIFYTFTRTSCQLYQAIGPCGAVELLARDTLGHELVCNGLEEFERGRRRWCWCCYINSAVSILLLPIKERTGEELPRPMERSRTCCQKWGSLPQLYLRYNPLRHASFTPQLHFEYSQSIFVPCLQLMIPFNLNSKHWELPHLDINLLNLDTISYTASRIHGTSAAPKRYRDCPRDPRPSIGPRRGNVTLEK